MQDERKRILQLVENGTITAEEAIGLLEKLSSQKESTPTPVSTNIGEEARRGTTYN